jgi:hypothetical protein
MQKKGHTSSRKKFLWCGFAAIASLPLLNIFKRRGIKKEVPVKMLTEDGQLVTISKKMLTGGRKVTNRELQEWTKK